MNEIKEAFSRVKQDMLFLQQEIDIIKNEIKQELESMRNSINELKNELKLLVQELKQASTHRQIKPTHFENLSTQQFLSTDNLYLEALKSRNLPVSIGNQGVTTDRQTHQQTDQHIEKQPENTQKSHKNQQNHKEQFSQVPSFKSSFEDVTQILDSLDNIKKDLRLKLKRITKQEMLIFSLIYQLEEEGKTPDYKALSKHLSVSESTIRDHIQRLISKGIPIEKEKINNKKIVLKIPKDFKKIASLNTILQLREL